MKEFEVTITETLQKSITVEAATKEEAQAMVEEMWDKGDVVLDADHFVGAEFSCNDGQEIEADKPIEVLLVEPGQYARMTTIGSSLEDMQKVVGGYIQEAPFFRDPVTLVCNEEGKISGLPLNRAIRDDDGKSSMLSPEPFSSAVRRAITSPPFRRSFRKSMRRNSKSRRRF